MKKFSDFIKEAKGGIVQTISVDLQNALNTIINAADAMQSAHWNLRSDNFIAMHPWLGESYGGLFDIADAIAEQIKILDIDTPVSISRTQTEVITDETKILGNLNKLLDAANAALEKAATNPTVDAPTKNLAEGWQAEVQKMNWFIKSSSKGGK